jgi:hypothetical protein
MLGGPGEGVRGHRKLGLPHFVLSATSHWNVQQRPRMETSKSRRLGFEE